MVLIYYLLEKPHNPMINAGAILICSLLKTLVKPEMTLAEKFDYTLETFTVSVDLGVDRLVSGSMTESIIIYHRECLAVRVSDLTTPSFCLNAKQPIEIMRWVFTCAKTNASPRKLISESAWTSTSSAVAWKPPARLCRLWLPPWQTAVSVQSPRRRYFVRRSFAMCCP